MSAGTPQSGAEKTPSRPTLREIDEAADRVRAYLNETVGYPFDERIAGYVTERGHFMLTRTDLRILIGDYPEASKNPPSAPKAEGGPS